jgi:lysyl-tRNA synthetase class 2
MRAITEDMICRLVREVNGSYGTTFTDTCQREDGLEKVTDHQIDWTTPFKRIEIIPALEAACGVSFPDNEQLHTDTTRVFLLGLLEEHGVACSSPQINARMLDKLIERFIESVCINPTFISTNPR